MADFPFIRDLTYLRRAFPPMRDDWNFAALAEQIRITQDLHGWEAYDRAERAEVSGTNLSSRTIQPPATGFNRYVYACSAFFDNAGGAAGPFDAFIQSNNVALRHVAALAVNQRICLRRPIVLTENDNLNIVLSAASGVGNLLLIAALFIDVPIGSYVRSV